MQPSQIALLKRASETAPGFPEFAQARGERDREREREEFSSTALNRSSQGVLFQTWVFADGKQNMQVKSGKDICAF